MEKKFGTYPSKTNGDMFEDFRKILKIEKEEKFLETLLHFVYSKGYKSEELIEILTPYPL